MKVPGFAFVAGNCPLVQENRQMAIMIFGMADGDPCTGCNHYNKGRCASHQQLKKVPPNFESLVVSSVRDHMGLSVLAMHLTASAGIHAGMLPFALHLLTSGKDPLQICDAGDMWNALKERYPSEDGGIDDSKLAEAIRQKLKEIGLP